MAVRDVVLELIFGIIFRYEDLMAANKTSEISYQRIIRFSSLYASAQNAVSFRLMLS